MCLIMIKQNKAVINDVLNHDKAKKKAKQEKHKYICLIITY